MFGLYIYIYSTFKVKISQKFLLHSHSWKQILFK